MMINRNPTNAKAEERKMTDFGLILDMIEKETMINMMMALNLQDIRD